MQNWKASVISRSGLSPLAGSLGAWPLRTSRRRWTAWPACNWGRPHCFVGSGCLTGVGWAPYCSLQARYRTWRSNGHRPPPFSRTLGCLGPPWSWCPSADPQPIQPGAWSSTAIDPSWAGTTLASGFTYPSSTAVSLPSYPRRTLWTPLISTIFASSAAVSPTMRWSYCGSSFFPGAPPLWRPVCPPASWCFISVCYSPPLAPAVWRWERAFAGCGRSPSVWWSWPARRIWRWWSWFSRLRRRTYHPWNPPSTCSDHRKRRLVRWVEVLVPWGVFCGFLEEGVVESDLDFGLGVGALGEHNFYLFAWVRVCVPASWWLTTWAMLYLANPPLLTLPSAMMTATISVWVSGRYVLILE